MNNSSTPLIIASTTSVQNSGLLEALIAVYYQHNRYDLDIQVVAVGTGKALRLAKKGQADLLLVHDPFREVKFISAGYGVNRRIIMSNEFVLVGPADDPAGIATLNTGMDALEKISEKACPFVSRGDDSGTNYKELDLWEDIGINPRGKGWYFETGADMGKTLLIADQKKAYTMVDSGTFEFYRDQVNLEILLARDKAMKNYYSLIAVNPALYPKCRYREAMDLIAFVTSPEGQQAIGRYTRHGVVLFQPCSNVDFSATDHVLH